MTQVQRKYLMDIEEAISHIENFVEITPTLDDYVANLLVRRAVERELEIIGEAMSQLLKMDSPPTLINARRIVDLRNRVIHGYDTVDDTIIWGVLKRHLPELKKEVATMLLS